jgi:hypothetical protein
MQRETNAAQSTSAKLGSPTADLAATRQSKLGRFKVSPPVVQPDQHGAALAAGSRLCRTQ